jgi:spermidine/putrescine transport system permease protein
MFSNFAVLVGMAYVFLPLMVLPVYAAIEKFDFRLAEAGYDLYASRPYCFRRVILPNVRPGLIAGSILVFVPALGAYVTPAIMGGGKTMMLGNLIEMQFGQGRNWPLGAALSLTLTLMVLLALVWYTRLTTGRGRSHG